MGRLAHMVAKDLTRRLRAPVSLVVMLIFPLAFAGMLGLAFGNRGSDGASGLPRIRILVVDLDKEFLSQFVSGASNSDEFNEQFELVAVATEEEGRRRMDDGEASALLIIPEGFTEHLVDEEPVTLELVKNPAQSILPQVVEEMAGMLAVTLDRGVRVLGEPLRLIDDTFSGVDDADHFPADDVLATMTLAVSGRLRPLLHYVFPPVVTYETVSEEDVPLASLLAARAGETSDEVATRLGPEASSAADDEEAGGGFNLFALFLPMISLMAILFLGENGMRDVLLERRAGTLARLFASPAGVRTVLFSKVLTTLVICAASLGILAAVGLALGWVSPSVSLPGALLQMAAIAVASTGLATLIYGFVRTDRAASSTHSAVVMAMSFMGGSFMPISQMPDALRRVAPYTINYWGVRGLTDLTVRGGGVDDVLVEAGVLTAIGLIGVAIGSRRLARRFAAGEAA
ncbi:MAG: ABC transporter permease [Acidobacteriota bacterium]